MPFTCKAVHFSNYTYLPTELKQILYDNHEEKED